MKAKAIIGRAALWAAVIPSICSCHRVALHTVTPAYYYWKAVLQLDAAERAALQAQPGTVLYLRFFDVDRDPGTGAPVPVAPLVIADTLPAGLSYVPVVFITNTTLEGCSPATVDSLGTRILTRVGAMAAALGRPYHAVQLDCDWTGATRERYFRLLDSVGARLHAGGRTLSVTIRLHQVKYRARTGVPPADRGMLMLYNTGDWKSPATKNSLYDPDVAARYLGGLPGYPLPLDLALPILRWSVVYRDGRFLTFLNKIAADTLSQAAFLKRLKDPSRFEVLADSFAFGCGLRRGDMIRSETCSFGDLRDGRKMVLQRLHNKNLTVALFHLDDALLKHETHAQIQEIFSSVQ